MNKIKELLTPTFMFTMTAILLAGCGNSLSAPTSPVSESTAAVTATTSGEDEQGEVTLQYSTTSTPGTVYVEAFNRMADEVKEKTGGKVTIVVFDSSQLGNESDVDTNVMDGSIDMCNTGSGELGKRYPSFNVFQTPYLFNSYEHFKKFIGSPEEENLFTAAKDSMNVIICGTQTMGARYVITTGAKAVTPEMFKGVKVRCPDMPSIISIVNGLGATAAPMAATEQYLAMQQGVVDGAEHTLSGFTAWNIQELCKELMVTGHAREVTFTMISQDCMNKLTTANQEILLAAIDSAAAWANEQTNSNEAVLMKQFQDEYGIELVEVDQDAFKAAVEPVAEELSADDPVLYEAIQKLD